MDRDKRKVISAHAGASVVAGADISACVIRVNNITVYRSLYVYRKVIGTGTPRYLDAVGVLHSLRALHDWTKDSPIELREIRGIEILAGSYQTVRALQRWPQGR